ncbi:hypothetical protein chiPu_0006455 [Chiloscyllium punctatum]|uniref:Uncharacterized protein n=1 Tax=Chiloscyllium punctatum TaxID=137246 RepID=A0A401SC94_CHIPU|nr:hypothetical protein [Chiloscyllium punctatum]
MLTTGVWESRDGSYIKIRAGNPNEVKITPQLNMPVTVEEGDQYGNEQLDALLAALWSQHDTDLGRVKPASPMEIRLKPGAGTAVKVLANEVILSLRHYTATCGHFSYTESACSLDGTPSLDYYDVTTTTVQGICPRGDVDDTSEEHAGPRL